MPYEVKATPIAARQIAAPRGQRRKAFDAFVRALAIEGCKALGYRLTGAEPLPRLCVKHLRGSDRAVVAFESETAWVLLVGPHDQGDRRIDVYAALYELAHVDAPETPRTKPPCCERGLAPVLDPRVVDGLIRRAGPRERRAGTDK